MDRPRPQVRAGRTITQVIYLLGFKARLLVWPHSAGVTRSHTNTQIHKLLSDVCLRNEPKASSSSSLMKPFCVFQCGCHGNLFMCRRGDWGKTGMINIASVYLNDASLMVKTSHQSFPRQSDQNSAEESVNTRCVVSPPGEDDSLLGHPCSTVTPSFLLTSSASSVSHPKPHGKERVN